MRQIILLSGNVGVGKDTAAEIISDLVANIMKENVADALKRITVRMWNDTFDEEWTVEMLDKYKNQGKEVHGKSVRWWLDKISRNLKKEFGEDLFIKRIFDTWLNSEKEILLIPDIRYKELDFFINQTKNYYFDLKHFVIVGPSRDRDNDVDTNLANVFQTHQNFSREISNDGGIEDFRKKIKLELYFSGATFKD